MSKLENMAPAAQSPPATTISSRVSFRKFPFRSQSLRSSPKKSGTMALSASTFLKPHHHSTKSPSTNGVITSSTSPSLQSSLPCLSRMEIAGHQLVVKPQPLFTAEETQRDSKAALLPRHQSFRFSRTQSLSGDGPPPVTPWSTTNFIVGNAPPPEDHSSPRSLPINPLMMESGGSLDDEGVDVVSDDLSDDDDEDAVSMSITGTDSKIGHGHRTVTLIRHPGQSLGLTVTGGGKHPLTILSIRPDSPAQLSGDIYIGDQIVSVNDVPINETTSHQDALRLLSECGNLISLVLKHSKAVMNHQKRWRQKMSSQARKLDSQTRPDGLGSLLIDQDNIKQRQQQKDLEECRMNLFLAGVSQYVSYSDKLRDCGFELQTNNDHDRSSLVVRCITKDIGFKWFRLIRTAIDQMTEQFVQGFNRHFLSTDHLFYMGYISEMVRGTSLTSPSIAGSLTNLSSQPNYRWLPRYLIIKGGKVYLFKKAPRATITQFQRRIQTIRMNSNGSSLGSMGSASSASETSNGSNYSTSQLVRPERMNRWLEKELEQQAISQWCCYTSDFRPVKLEEQIDEKNHCFLIYSEKPVKRYFSTESQSDIERLNHAWNISNYISVIKNEKKIYTVVWEKENIIGSLKIDWNHGFSFYDPARKQYLWSYQFYQLKHSSDDDRDKLLLTFMIDPKDSRIIDQHILRCSCLQTLIYCIHAFLRAKVFSLNL